MKDPSKRWIGFPPPLLGSKALRLEVLYAQNALLALDKPKGVLVDAHPRHSDYPAVISALRPQMAAKKAGIG